MTVSAIVTSFNHAEYLDQRMQSLLAQTYPLHEIIVVDDCSTDNSLAVLEKYKTFPNVNIISLKENQGYANACNVGVSKASGDFIIFSECDDYCEIGQIETMLSKFDEGSSIGVVFSSSNIVDQNGTFLINDFIFREKRFKAQCHSDCLIKSKDMQMYFAVSCVIPNMSAALIKKEYLLSLGGFSKEYKLCADWNMWCRLSRTCDFYYLREPLNNFRTHPTSVGSLSKIDQRISEIMDLLYDHFGKMDSNCRRRVRFFFGIADILMGFSSSGIADWVKAFPSMYVKSISHDKLNIIVPIVGITRKALRLLARLCRR